MQEGSTRSGAHANETPTRRPQGGQFSTAAGQPLQAARPARTRGTATGGNDPATLATRRIDARLMYTRNYRGLGNRILTRARNAATPSTAGRPALPRRAHASNDEHVK